MQPFTNADGTITAVISEPARHHIAYSEVSLRLPAGLAHGILAGKYFLVRCGAQSEAERNEQWHFYLRRALFVTSCQVDYHSENEPLTAYIRNNRQDCWQIVTSQPVKDSVQLAQPFDQAERWIASLERGDSVNLLGPFGNGFQLLEPSRNLLLVADESRVAMLFPLIEPVLDRNGRVTLLLRGRSAAAKAVTEKLPIAVEILVAETDDEWQAQIDGSLDWADQLCAALPSSTYSGLAEMIRRKRFRLEPNFAQMLVEAELVCGVGACLACVVPTASGGLTRACVHGPVLDLATLVR